ncbi:MAG: hypothetical protein KGJ44_13225 [Betaproteobacteria bacterium]|nr:hypothetical protein [Betaproteobacteria bacterium]
MFSFLEPLGPWAVLVEALMALGIFVGIIWWTMFSGRQRGELPPDDDDPAAPPPPPR